MGVKSLQLIYNFYLTQNLSIFQCNLTESNGNISGVRISAAVQRADWFGVVLRVTFLSR